MNVCTDNPRFAEQWFSSPPRWEAGVAHALPAEMRLVLHRLLPTSPVATASIDLPGPWQHMVLVEHAMRSQFDILVDMLRAGLALPHGFVCLAGSAEGFHGQRRRLWTALPGNIHCSVFFSPGCRLNDIAAGLTVLPAVSLVRLLDSIPGLEHRAGIRWVNDIVVDGAKLAGFLVHTQSVAGKVTGAVIGIGLNAEAVPTVPPTVFVPSVTALRALVSDPRAWSLPLIFHRLLHHLAHDLEKLTTGGSSKLLELYRERSMVVGRDVEVYADGEDGTLRRSAEGRVHSIGDRLELLLAGGHRPVYGGRLVMKSVAASAEAAPASTLSFSTPA
jgi:biotin-(acetyl-CoA carboxylase) ligase